MNQKSHNLVNMSERGGAGAKLLVFVVIALLIAHAGYNFIPTAYQGESFRQELQSAVVQGVTMPSTYGKPSELVKFKVANAARISDIPLDAVIDVKDGNSIVTARVYYVKKVPILPFGIYDYDYVFDHTATPSGFLTQ